MLKELKILDLTHRLPGPLAGKILADMGAQVIKLEDQKHQDPFLSGMFSSFDRSFENWYAELNQAKEIVRLDFKAADIKQQIQKHLQSADGVLMSLSPKLKLSLGLDDDSLRGLKRPLAVVELEASSTHNKAMHDLNALAISGYLSLHVAQENASVVAPPFLPVAGIAFGQQVATQMLANFIAAQKSQQLVQTTSYLHDTVETIFQPFWSKELRNQHRTKFLHNGAYPCYSLYRAKDGDYVAVAAVEEKFWQDLSSIFNIPLSLAERFNTDAGSFDKVAEVFAKLSTNEIDTLAKDKELCISIVRKIS